MVDELREQVAKEIGKIARPREIHVVPELPKTRSGKIMRRLLRDVAEGRELGDTSTLVDPSVFEAIRAEQVVRHAGHAPPTGTKPDPGRFLAVMSASCGLIDMFTAGVCSGMNLMMQVGSSSVKAPWIMPTSRLLTVTGAPESPGCPHT